MTQVLWPSPHKFYGNRFWPDRVWHLTILGWWSNWIASAC